MRNLSKSKIIAYRQCPKRLWLEIHEPERAVVAPDVEARFAAGNEVGAVARSLYDPGGQGTVLDAQRDGFDAAFDKTGALLKQPRPIFEAGFRAQGALAFADVMMPVDDTRPPRWHMIEVKSATSVKDYHRDDAAVQAYVARAAGADLAAVSVAHVDSTWVYPGGGDYRGMLKEEELTQETLERAGDVKDWIAEAQATARATSAPQIAIGAQCHDPFDCPYLTHCRSQVPAVDHPVEWLPGRKSRALAEHLETKGARDLRDVPDEMLDPRQLRVKRQTLKGEVFFDAAGAKKALSRHPLPAMFLDFETAQLAVPIWPGTRPWQQIPFQFSLHKLDAAGRLEHQAHLDLSGLDPSEAFARALITACEGRQPIFVYNAAFETGRIRELAQRFSSLAPALTSIAERIVDLLPIAREHYYHPSQQGSWSIKAVLPAMAPDLSYDKLSGVKDGSMAMIAYLEAIRAGTSTARKEEIHRELLEYCKLDTLAMVRVWQFLSGRNAIVPVSDAKPRGWARRMLQRVGL